MPDVEQQCREKYCNNKATVFVNEKGNNIKQGRCQYCHENLVSSAARNSFTLRPGEIWDDRILRHY